MKMLHWTVYCLVIIVFVGEIAAQDSLGMRHVSTLDYWYDVEDIIMVGDIAYVSTDISGLYVMDLSDPANPVEVSHIPIYRGFYKGMDVVGNRLYVGSYWGVAVYDITEPTSPVLLGEGGDSFWDLRVFGDYAVAEYMECCPDIWDVSDPNDIHLVGTFDPYWTAVINGPLEMVGDYLYMLGYGIFIWDVSDSAQPVIVDSLVSPTLSYCMRGVITGNFAYISSFGNGVRIIDLSDPLHPLEVGGFDVGLYDVEMSVSGDRLLVHASDSLVIYNIADPVNPFLESVLQLYPRRADAYSVTCSGNIVCVEVDRAKEWIAVVDISQATMPVEVGSFGQSGFLHRMTVDGTVGYLANGWSLATVDLTDPSDLSELGRPTARITGTEDTAVRGNYAYAAAVNNGLGIMDISDPANPESLATFFLENPRVLARRILIDGDYAYVADGYDGDGAIIHAISLLDPLQPAITDTAFEATDSFFGMVIEDGYLYLGTRRIFHIYSLNDPAYPDLVGTCDLPFSALGASVKDLTLIDDYSYVAYYEGGLLIIDVSDIEHPIPISSTGDFGHVSTVVAWGSTLFTNNYSRINVLNIADPLAPELIGYYDTPELVSQMTIYGSYLLTVSRTELRSYECDALDAVENPGVHVPDRIELHPCFPNPFNPTTTISFSLPHSQRTSISVYDLTGRKVSTLADEVMNAGVHAVTFDASGLPSGIYFTRLEAGGMMQTRKMVLLR